MTIKVYDCEGCGATMQSTTELCDSCKGTTEVQNEAKCLQCGDIIPPLNVYPNKLCDSCYMVDDLGNSVTAKLEVQND